MTLPTAPILPFPEIRSFADRFTSINGLTTASVADAFSSSNIFTAMHPGSGVVWMVRWFAPTSHLVVSRTGAGADGAGSEELWRREVKDAGERRALIKNIVDQFAAFNEQCDKAAGGGAVSRGVGWLKDYLVALVRRPKSIWSVLRALLKWFLIFMGLLLCFTLLMQYLYGYKGPVSPGAASPPAAGVHPVPAELRDRALGDALTMTEMQVLANATREVGVQMRPTGQPFVVFSDPNCPACKDLESKLSQVDPRFVPVIVPVSFKPGSDELVKRVFCAKDTVAAWSVAVGGLAATGDAASDGACPDAAQKALSANAAFTALNFSATPTLVSATGKVVAGSGSIERINKWLDTNGGLPATPAQKP
ncbi:thioredoxin fold domain-containing protein [Variovorax durovernensis]